jgi:hypothetical protein
MAQAYSSDGKEEPAKQSPTKKPIPVPPPPDEVKKSDDRKGSPRVDKEGRTRDKP